MQALQADDVAVVELRHQQEELGLRPRVCCHYLVHPLQRRHGRRWTPQVRASRLRSAAGLGNRANCVIAARRLDATIATPGLDATVGLHELLAKCVINMIIPLFQPMK